MVGCPTYVGPIYGGIIAGVVHTVVSPDHLSTIVTLSACQGVEAFWFGVRWAGGHLMGMGVIGVVFAAMHAHFGEASLEVYEHYADYAIGVMLFSCGLYFLLNADKYVDAEWTPKYASCSCHGHQHDQGEAQALLPEPSPKSQEGGKLRAVGLHKAGSVLVGFVQGVACPGGLIGIAFLKQYQPLEIAIFTAIFIAITTVSMGLIAMLYGVLTQRMASTATVARAIYLTSCCVSIFFGLLWTFLNATGRLDAFFGHDHDHEALHHVHEMLLAVAVGEQRK